MKTVIDIKATAKEEPSWSIQGGAYQSMIENDTEVWRDNDHRYFDMEGAEYRSVTGLIKDVGILPSWAGLGLDHPHIINARERGKAIETAIYAALTSDDPRTGMAPVRWGDVMREWWPGYVNWLDDHHPEYISHHGFVADPAIKVAGEYDLCVEGDGIPCVLHLNPKLPRGYKLIRYEKALIQWGLVAEARADSLNRFALTRARLERI
jgi:hypothetical protein